jgi:phosphinothricin acetyltransferase
MRPEIRALAEADWASVSEIYREGIASGRATFETVVPTWETWNQAHLVRPRIVAAEGGEVIGWAALSPVSKRAVYAGVAAVSIYVATSAQGRGVGRALLDALIEAAEEAGIWTLQAGVFAINEASIGVHRRCGFREVGLRERIGQLQGVWQDVVLLERRSSRVGIGPAPPR